MADQKIGVILDFKANTSQAKQSMTQLQQLLTQVSTGAGIKVDSGSIVSASKAAKELAYHLSAAYNADTGKLDLGKLNASLNSAKANIGDLSSKLLSAGKTGQAAFVQLAKSMSMAEAPAFKLNGIVSKLWTSLKNVATWQISSTVLMGLTSSISEAYQFAQDLNESLTEIRIVTGNSTEEMQRFAKEANKAAKALSTTTTKYTDASLIYFQQGLNEKQVKERTDLTIKMANVTGQSVSEVSDQLTAVWNNFDNGTKSLEYYVDVMTALGAATASSSEEISEGLNKFAAVAETVGLSYEYAAAALTTVTATTRQSADVVGTAFKTLFARIQDLELGETLDDGTTMGQYSQALAAVGINIKDVNGEVKDMNIILDEMGAKWNTLTKDTQIALAQNVAGVRQYTQLIALMDNWSYFQENLNTAYSSTGELQKQADIYAEGWEAARDRVTANLEDIYKDILKDDFFIGFLNGVADIIEGVDTFIEKLGGIEPIIISLSSLLLNSISNKIQPALYGIISSMRSITSTGAAKEAAAASQPFISKIDAEIATGNYNQSDRTALENSKQLLQVKNKLWVATKDMTEAEKQMAQIDLELLENEQSKLQVIADTITKLEQEVATQEQLHVAAKMQIQQTTKLKQEESELQSRVSETKRQYEEQLQIIRTYPKKIADAEAEVTHLNQILSQTKPNTDTWKQLSSRIQDINAQIEAMYLTWENAETVVGDNKVGFGADYEQAISDLEAFRTANENTAKTVAVVGDAMVRAYQQAGQEAVKAGADAAQAFEEGRTKISLSRVSKSFFAQNQSSFADLSIEDDLEATRVGVAKTQIGTLQDMLGVGTIGQVEGLSDLFNDAEVASSGQELQQIIEQIKAALDAASVSAGSFEEAISDFGEIGKKSVAEVKKPITELNAQHQALVKKQQELNIQAAKFNPKHYASGTEVFAKMTSGVTSAVMALNGLNAITKQLKENGPPDSFDEWMSIITSLTFVVPQLVNAYKAIGGALTSLSGPIAANNALMATQLYTIDAAGNKIPAMTVAELYNAAAKKAGAEATEDQIKAEIAALAVSQGLIDANGAEAFSESVLTAAKQKGTIWSSLKTAADNGSFIAKKLLQFATWANIVAINAETGAVIANTAAWYANPIFWIAAAVIGVTAAIIGLVGWLIKMNDSLSESERAALELEEARKTAKGLSDQLEETADQANALRNAFKEYSEITDSLKELVEGTDEWKNALIESQNKLRELLNLYPELRKLKINGESAIQFDQSTGLYTAHEDLGVVINDINYRKEIADRMAKAAGEMTVEGNENRVSRGKTLVRTGEAIFDTSYWTKDTEFNETTMQETGHFYMGDKKYEMTSASNITMAKDPENKGYLLTTTTGMVNEYIGNLQSLFVNNKDAIQTVADFEEIYNNAFSGKESFDSAVEEGIFTQEFADNIVATFKNNLSEILAEGYGAIEQETIAYRESLQTQSTLLAADMLSTSSEFMSANATQRQAAQVLLAKSISEDLQKITEAGMLDDDGWGEELTKDMYGFLSKAIDYEIDFEQSGWQANADLVDNLESTGLGKELKEFYVNKYGEKGQELEWDKDAQAYKMGDAEVTADQIVQSIASAYVTESKINEIPEIMKQVVDSNAALTAGIAGNFLSLSQDEISQISTGDGANRKFTKEYEEQLKQFLSPEEIEIRKAALKEYNVNLAETVKKQQQLAESEAMIKQASEEYDLDEDVLRNYAKSLQATNDAYKDNYKLATEAAIANAKFSVGLEKLRGIVKDNIKLFKNWDPSNYETLEAATEAAAALTEMFGVDVSTNFVKEIAQSGDLEKLISGGEESAAAFEKLEVLAAQDYVASLGLSGTWEQDFNNLLTYLNDLESTQGIGIPVDLNDTQYINSLNEMLKEGTITADQVKKAFGAIGWSPNITYGTKEGPTTETTGTYTVIGPDKKEQTYEYTHKQTSQVSYPILGDKDSNNNATGKNIGSYIGSKSSSNFNAGLNSSKNKGQKKKTANDEIDRYHEIKEELSDIENELDAISKAKDRAFGADKLKLIDKEIAKNKELLAAQEEYIKQIQEKAIEDQKAANAVGISTDESGRISNYDEIMGQAIDEYNAAVNALNSGNLDEAGFEAAEKKYENFIKVLNQYEETLNLLEDEQQKFTDNQNKIIDLGLEEVEYQVELKIKINDNDIKKLEWMLKKLDDPINDAAEAVEKLGQIALKNLSNLETYKQGIEDTFAQVLSEDQLTALLENNDFSVLNNVELTANQVSALEKYRDSLYDTSDTLDEFYEQVMTKVNGAFEGYNKEMEEHIEEADRYKAVVETYLNVIDLVGKKTLGVSNETVKALRRAQYEATKTSVTGLKEQLAMNRDLLAQAAAERDKYQNDSEEYKYWDEQVNTIQEKVNSLESSIQSSWTNMLQEAADIFASSVEDVTSAFEEAMAGTYGTYEKMQKMFDQQKEISDRFVDNYKQVYELSKLNRDITKSMDSMDSVAGKEALRDLQEEINRLQESGAEMSEYDLEYLRKKYDLRVAEIALEEAQNAKSQVRMQRDAEGNWGYVYTADESKTADAEQNYEDKLYAIQEHSQSYMEEMEQKVIETEQRMLEEISGLRAQDFESEEAYQVEIDRITKYYTEQRSYYLDELNQAIGNSSEIYNNDWLAYEGYNGKKLEADRGWRDQFNETTLSQVGDYQSVEDARSKFDVATTNMLSSLTSAFGQWQIDVHDAFTAVGEDFKAFGGEDGTAATTANNATEKLGLISSEIESWGQKAVKSFADITKAVNDEFTDFQTAFAPYKEETQGLIDLINEALRLKAENETTTSDTDTDNDTTGDKPGASTGLASGGGASGGNTGNSGGNNWDNGIYSTEQVKAAQAHVGAEVDGLWGINSITAAKNKGFNNLADVISYLEGLKTFVGELVTDSYVRGKDGVYYAKLEDGTYIKAKDLENNIVDYEELMPGQTQFTVATDKLAIYTADQVGQYKPITPSGGGGGGWRGQFMTKMNTGGYTGAWGPEGRIAMLHEKELVLNPDDTANFLSAINIVRDIASLIDLRAAAQQSALSMMSATSIAPTTQTLQQEVTIHAEFPNATQRTEIEAAFDTLLNRASQFANRKI